jgi:uncharacterized protein (TIGR00251 family)
MIINIKVIPRAKRATIKDGNPLRVYVNQPPEDGRANDAVIKLLSEHFKIPKSKIKIIKGEKSREKIIEISK